MMKSTRITCLLCLLGLTLPNLAYAIDKWEYKLDLEYGFRVDQFDWNIASNLAGTSVPNVISELKWSDVGFHEARLGFRFIGDQTWYLKGYTTQGWGFQGANQDSDYNKDDRSSEYSRSTADSDRSSAEDFSIAIGQQIRIDNRFGITPLVGFSSHRQNFTMTNGSQILCVGINEAEPNYCPGVLGAFPDLNSSFTTHWRGPWLGLDLRFASANRWTTYAELEYHYSYYDAKANWNLRTDLEHPVSQSQSARGQGVHLGLGMSYALSTPNSFLNFGFTQKEYSTRAGVHSFYDIERGTINQRLNGVNWRSSSATIGITSQY
jgi:outer membrane protease